ncbi:MAG: hypothetical protein RL338_576 [Chloroflexota bacterium]
MARILRAGRLAWLIATAGVLAASLSLVTGAAATVGTGPLTSESLYACSSPAPAEVSTGTTTCP